MPTRVFGLSSRVSADLDNRSSKAPHRRRRSFWKGQFLEALNPKNPAPELAWAWRRLAQAHGCVPVQKLAGEIGWSRQHFRERFHGEFGVPPKTAARIFRFEHALRLIKGNLWSLAQVAAECGYHDQAHMTHEWKALAGCTPKAWIAKELPFFQYSDRAAGDNSCDDLQPDDQPPLQRPVRSGLQVL
jgi:AraC-like DNA-binding protein